MICSIKIKPNKLPGILKAMRFQRGLSQKQVADKLGLNSAATISHYERGLRSPSMDMMIKLFEIYGWAMTFRLTPDDEVEE